MGMTTIEQLRELRRLSGLTQSELAQKAGLTRMAVQRIESNTSDPRLSTVQCLARACQRQLNTDTFFPASANEY